jgi:hypothetical protein
MTYHGCSLAVPGANVPGKFVRWRQRCEVSVHLLGAPRPRPPVNLGLLREQLVRFRCHFICARNEIMILSHLKVHACADATGGALEDTITGIGEKVRQYQMRRALLVNCSRER